MLSDISITTTPDTTNVDNWNGYGKRSNTKIASISYIDFMCQVKITTKQWTRYLLCTTDCTLTHAYGFAINQDTGISFVVETDGTTKNVYLKIENTVLKANSWIRGHISLFTY